MKMCAYCGSADTVGYWDVKAHQGDALFGLMCQEYYPDARECVRCGFVDADSSQRKPDFARITKDQRARPVGGVGVWVKPIRFTD